MHMKKNILALALASTGIAASASWVMAADQTVDVAATFRQAITFNNLVNIDYTPTTSRIEYTGTPAGTDTVTIASDGSIVVAGNFTHTTGTGTPGSVDIVGDSVSAVTITCSASATLGRAGPLTVSMNEVGILMNTAGNYAAFAGTGIICAGTGGTSLAHTLDGTDTVYLGGRIVGNATVVTGAYSTTLASGVPITLRVVYT